MEIALGFVAVSVFIWVFVSDKRDKEFIGVLKARNDIENKKLFVEQCRHQQMVKRWEEHKAMKSLGDFKKRDLSSIIKGTPNGIKVPTEADIAFQEVLRRSVTKVGSQTSPTPTSTANH